LPDEIEPPAQPEPEPEEYPNLKPLELLGYYIDEDGNVWVDISDWEICEPDVFREYMFGTWEGQAWMNWDDEYLQLKDYFFLDDSEETYSHNLRFAYKYYRYGDTVIFFCSNYQVEGAIFWLDINEPDILYNEILYSRAEGVYTLAKFSQAHIPPRNLSEEITYLIKIDGYVNEPENGYMSRLRLYEIMRDYDIDFELIFDIRHIEFIDGQYIHFTMDGYFNTFPIYLISEEPDKLVFKSSVSEMWEAFVDVIYIIEKVNGGWTRTIEIDQKQLEAATFKMNE
ncbi:MAG: hypothetical protein FWE74_07915, partial [Oscillospiraceae bacterium]|nr:hypothetical protein [Oscillospiraceae bacterium]